MNDRRDLEDFAVGQASGSGRVTVELSGDGLDPRYLVHALPRTPGERRAHRGPRIAVGTPWGAGARHARAVAASALMLFETVAEYEKVKGYAVEGNRQNLDRLEAELARMA